MSAYTERIKLEAMYYHARDPQHVQFLQTRESYAWFRTVNTFKAGKFIVDAYEPSAIGRGKTSITKAEKE